MNNYWIIISFIATLVTAIGSISLKLINESKYDNNIFLALTFIIMGLLSLIYLLINQKFQKKFLSVCDRTLIIFVVLFAFLLIFNNYIIQYAFSISPNIAYSHIIINLNVIITLVAAYYIFKQNINLNCLLGIFISLFGIGIIAYNS